MPQPATILVVDDDIQVRDYAVEILADAGFQTVVAENGPQAIAALEDHAGIALLFTDVVMPGIDGIMLADMATSRWPALKVVYATGYHDVARSLPGVIHGPILDKPYRMAALLSTIATVLGSLPSAG